MALLCDYRKNFGSDSDDEMQSQASSEVPTEAATLAGQPDKFDEDTFHQLLLEFIITGDQSLNLVESPAFRALLLLLRHDINIPDQNKLQELIIQAWERYFEVLKPDLQRAVGRVSFTMDIWSDQIRRPYLVLTAHWIAEIAKNILQLKSSLIGFHRLDGNSTLANTVLELLDRAEITVKVGHFTFGNVGNHEVMMKSLEKTLDAREIAFDAADRKVMCLGRVVDLGSERVIHAVTNTVDKEDDPSDEASAPNPIELARDVVQGIRESGDAFDQVIVNGNTKGWFTQGQPPETVELNPLPLLLDVHMKWDSVFYMLQRLREMRPAVDYLLGRANDSSDLAKCKISSDDWLAMQDLEIVLCMPHLVQQVMSDKGNPSLSDAIPEFEMLMKRWEVIIEKKPSFGAARPTWAELCLHALWWDGSHSGMHRCNGPKPCNTYDPD